jgi:hypothetical protein
MNRFKLVRLSIRAIFFVALVLFALAGCTNDSQRAQPTADPALDTTPTAASDQTPTGHDATEGVTLAPNNTESVYAGALCPASAPVRQYNVVAINVEITLNRYLDYDPQGRMFVLEQDLARVRAEEAQNKLARADQAEPAVSIGLQGDAIQPLTLRVNQGECLRVTLRNALNDNEPASIHLHGSSWHIAGTGTPAIATNPDATIYPGQSVTYEWMVTDDEPEGTHYFHSHGDERLQTSHGLFGAVIVEQKGSTWIDPLTGSALQTGWSAIIQPPQGSAFREFAIYYHEIGDERYRHLNKAGQLVAQVDPYTGSYRPGDRAINYRSEPFMNRLDLQEKTIGKFDKSAPYSSYAFGDPATPIARSYLGDPVKQRVIHAGSEVFHVHHVHGGSIRWRRQPDVESSYFDTGLQKHPPLIPDASEWADSQSLGPSETFDLVDECGSGGCQQSVGDYLIHCHVAQHYLSGMWMIWRVYDTLQDGKVSEDALPPLQELPDRRGQMKAAVTSQELIGTTVDWKGKTFTITQQNLTQWVEQQLPPQGVPKGYDASVLDWSKDGTLYLNEPESDKIWPGFRSASPGIRLPFYFDPVTGKLAYPFLRPHLAQRPPFAPNHGPAPFLDPIHQGTDLPQPGENGPWSVCPTGTKPKQFNINAIALPIALNQRIDLIDPSGAIYVLQEQEDAVRADGALKVPLTIRANAGEDCIDILLKSELNDTRENGFLSKVDIHIHFVQFDIQASDGVDTGFNYEQSVRPFTIEGEKLVADATAGSASVRLTSADRFQPGVVVGVGMQQIKTFEVMQIKAINGDTVTFNAPLKFAHGKNEIVSTEFVRYRWYPDVQFGTAYFHDHVDPLNSWVHGLFGALIAEPPQSTYNDPHTGAPVTSGPIADIHTPSKVSADIVGSFRELVMFIQDNNPITHVGNSSGSSFNLRVEPLANRNQDPGLLFSSKANGDPATPLLETFLGDPIVVRTLVGGTNDVHTWHLDGHWFRQEPYSSTSPPIDTIHLGISERYDLAIPHAGGPQQMPGDYLYYNGRAFKLQEGSWGIVRVYDGSATVALKKLPGHETIPVAASSVCPTDAPQKQFAVFAIDVALPMLGKDKGKIYVLQSDADAVRAGTKSAEPLVLHVNIGDCIKINLKNETSAGAVSFHADMLAFDPRDSYGIAAGNDPAQAVAPGASRTYTFYASPEIGETTALVRDWGNVIANPRLGLYGAIVVGPRGTTYTDPMTGADVSTKASWRVDAHPPSAPAYRDFSLFIQDEDAGIGTSLMPYTQNVAGVVAMNYRAEPFAARMQQNPDPSKVFRSDVHGDPATPLLEAFAGDAVRVHVLVPYSEQSHVFSIENHVWQFEPGRAGTNMLSATQAGALDALTLLLANGAGGPFGLPGDYVYGDHRMPYEEAGLWGLFRVYPRSAASAKIKPLSR